MSERAGASGPRERPDRPASQGLTQHRPSPDRPAQREQLRAADVDRQFVADRLKTAVDEGRLSLYEYDERLQQTYAAKTYGDLDRVLLDLPAPATAPASAVVPARAAPGALPAKGVPDAAARSLPRWLSRVWGAWLVAVSVCVVIWLMVSVSNGEADYFWPMWVAAPWGAVLLAATVNGLLRGEPYGLDERRADRQARMRDRREYARSRRDYARARRDEARARRARRRGY